MSDKKIYIINVSRTDAVGLSVMVQADSVAGARAFVARNMIDARLAKPAELLGVDPSTVIDAETGLPLDLANDTIEQAAQQLADADTAVGGTD